MTENGFSDVSDELEEMRQPKPQRLSVTFIIFMLALGGLCVWLGFWQLERLEEKTALIAKVEDRAQQAPVPLPKLAEWVALDPEVYDFRQVRFSGHYVPQSTLFVFTALTDPRGARSGPGYWVMNPFALDDGGYIFVNRGFIPEAARDVFGADSKGTAPPEGEVTLTGVARVPERISTFTPGPDIAKKTEYVRSVERMQALVAADLTPFAQFYIDLPAAEGDALPQGGETVMQFTNRHFEYALTWFGFAIVDALMLGAWIWRGRKRTKARA